MRSDNVKTGSERAPNRSLFYALGYTPEELDRPLIGVVSAYSEIVPGHMNLDKIADAVKAGVEMAGGTPILMPAISVCDGIAMGHAGMTRRHEVQPAQPRADLRQRRDHVPGPPAGRPGPGAQLRQDRARHGDGGLPAGRAGGGLLGRAHAGRQLWRRGGQPVQDVRGGGA